MNLPVFRKQADFEAMGDVTRRPLLEPPLGQAAHLMTLPQCRSNVLRNLIHNGGCWAVS